MQVHPANGEQVVRVALEGLEVTDCTATASMYATLLGNVGTLSVDIHVQPEMMQKKAHLAVPSKAQVVLNPAVIMQVAKIFEGPEFTKQFQDAANEEMARQMETARQTAAAAYHGDVMVFSVDVQAPVIILPQDCGSATAPCLYADLGHLLVSGGSRERSPAPSADSLLRDELSVVHEYHQASPLSDTLTVELKGLQILLSDRGVGKHGELDQLLQSSNDDKRLLRPFNVTCKLDMGSSEGANKMVADARTTNINIVTSTVQVRQLMLFQPPPSGDAPLPQPPVDADDEDGDVWELNRTEVGQMMVKSLGVQPTEVELDRVMRRMDADGSGSVDHDEFKRWAERSLSPRAPSSQAIYFLCPELSWSLVEANRSPVLTASIRNVRAGLATLDDGRVGEMNGCFLLAGVQIQGSSSAQRIMKTDTESAKNLLQVTVDKNKENEIPLTTITLDIMAGLTLEWHPKTIENLHAQVGTILAAKGPASAVQTLPNPSKTQSAAQSAVPAVTPPPTQPQPTQSIEAMRVVAKISKLTVSLASRETGQPLYLTAISDMVCNLLDTSALTEERRLQLLGQAKPAKRMARQTKHRPVPARPPPYRHDLVAFAVPKVGTTFHGTKIMQLPKCDHCGKDLIAPSVAYGCRTTSYELCAECYNWQNTAGTGALHVEARVGAISVQDLSTPESPLSAEVVGRVNEREDMIQLIFDQYDKAAAVRTGCDSKVWLQLNTLQFVIIPETINELVQYMKEDVVGVTGDQTAVVAQQAAQAAQQAAKNSSFYVQKNEVSVVVKGPHIMFYPDGSAHPTVFKMTDFPNVLVDMVNDQIQVQLSKPSIIMECSSDYGGVQVDLLSLRLDLDVFNLTVRGLDTTLHATLAAAAEFRSPKSESWQQFVRCTPLGVDVKMLDGKAPHVVVKPVGDEEGGGARAAAAFELTLSDALLYSCSQAFMVTNEASSQLTNHTGVPLRYWVGPGGGQPPVHHAHRDPVVQLLPGAAGPLLSAQASSAVLHIAPEGFAAFDIPLAAVGQYVKLLERWEAEDPAAAKDGTFVVMAALDRGAMMISCSGTVRVDNHSSQPFEVVALCGRAASLCGHAAPPGASAHLGVSHSGHDFGLRMLGQTVVSGAIFAGPGSSSNSLLYVPADGDGDAVMYSGCNLRVKVETVGPMTVVSLSAALQLQNLLPCDATFTIYTPAGGASGRLAAAPGETVEIFALGDAGLDSKQGPFRLEVSMVGFVGSGEVDPAREDNQLEISQVRSGMALGLTACFARPDHCEVFTGYWFCNRSGLSLQLRTPGDAAACCVGVPGSTETVGVVMAAGQSAPTGVGTVCCVAVGSASELQIAAPGTEFKTVKVGAIHDGRLRLRARVAKRGLTRQMHDLHVTVDAATAPFDRTRVITVDTRPALASGERPKPRLISAGAAAPTPGVQDPGFNFELTVPRIHLLLRDMAGLPPSTPRVGVQLPQLAEEGLVAWAASELDGALFGLQVFDLRVSAAQRPAEPDRPAELDVRVKVGGVRLVDEKKPAGHDDRVVVEAKDLGLNLGGAAGMAVDAGGWSFFNCLSCGALSGDTPWDDAKKLFLDFHMVQATVPGVVGASFNEFAVAMPKGLRVVLNDRQILRLLAAADTMLRNLAPATDIDPGAVVHAMQVPFGARCTP
jgi:hypothetical protein